MASDTIASINDEEDLFEQLQREKHLRQLDLQEKAKLQRARDQLALQVEKLLAEQVLLDEDFRSKVSHDDRDVKESKDEGAAGHDAAELEEEIEALQGDIDILLREVEEERRINKELEKMVQAKEYEKEKVEIALSKMEEKFQRLKKKKIGDDHEDHEELVDGLKSKIALLTASQHELIASLDASADELDKISKENQAMCDTIMRLKDICNAYENQVQEHVRVAAHLQELLEEGSEWKVPQGSDRPLSIPPLRTTHTTTKTSEEEFHIMKEEYQQTLVHYKALEDNVSQWQSKCALLQTQVLALCAELTRLSGCASGMQSCIVPMLTDIESKLTSLVYN